MKKELPKVFENKIEKKIKNNSLLSKTSPEKLTETKDTTKVEKQISRLFSSKEYIYKIPVKIETDTEIIQTKIIGKNKQYLITIDNKKIEIKKIRKIECLKIKENE